jgi:heme o synthase
MDTTPGRSESTDQKFQNARELITAYVSLTKPRVISLLLFTAGAAMFAAAKGWPGFIPFLAVMVGGYLSAGAANTMNMVIDRDIDGRMSRTAKRPTVTQAISSTAAMNFALALTLGSFAVLWAGANLWAAMIAFSGQVFYVCVYTLMLKRRTWQNIVIGGAAGAVPPMVGWVAVTGNLNAVAWWMFALIFIWTPVHFWALALLLKDDYAEAGVPMLPVAKGERATATQISFYTALTVALSLLPFFAGYSGLIFLLSAIAFDLVLIRLCVNLSKKIERPQASALFHYSMLYLALLFLAVAVDQRWLIGNF